jgi:hypothetical protein
MVAHRDGGKLEQRRRALPSALSSATYDAANQQTGFAGTTLTYDLNWGQRDLEHFRS